MFPKAVLLYSVLFIVGSARAQCPNGGFGIGLMQLCNVGNPISGGSCDDTDGFMTTPGSFNTASLKVDIDTSPHALCGQGWQGDAFVTCDANQNVISANPPGEGTSNCVPASIIVPGSNAVTGVAEIYYCCHL